MKYKFKLNYAEKYWEASLVSYNPNQTIEVYASDYPEAKEKALKVLGNPRDGFMWVFRSTGIEEV